MSQKGRVLTLVIEFTDDTYPQWIMDAHMKGPQNGVKVKKISEDDKLAELDQIVEVALEGVQSHDRNDKLDDLLEEKGYL